MIKIKIKKQNITGNPSIKDVMIGKESECNGYIDTLTRRGKTTLFIGLPDNENKP